MLQDLRRTQLQGRRRSDGRRIDIGDEQGQCDSGSDDVRYCDAFLRADGSGIYPCINNSDCDAIAPICDGSDCGNCELVERERCFLDPIVAAGNPDANAPLMADTLYLPASLVSTLNSAYGLPGPERVRLQLSVTRP